MANIFIEPTFENEADQLLFLSRLWGVTITPQDVLDWAAYKLLRPVEKLPTESRREFYEHSRSWNDGRYARYQIFLLSKWESYRLGKVPDIVVAYLSTRPSPNRQQAREAVRLHLVNRFALEIVLSGVDVAADLLPLVQGLVWNV